MTRQKPPHRWWYDEETHELRLSKGCKAKVRLCSWGILRIHVQAQFDFDGVPDDLKREAMAFMIQWAETRSKQLSKKRKYELTFALVNL